jgi:hypothetical protein
MMSYSVTQFDLVGGSGGDGGKFEPDRYPLLLNSPSFFYIFIFPPDE